MSVSFSDQVRVLWKSAIHVVVWSVWLARNRWIFESKTMNFRSALSFVWGAVSDANRLEIGCMRNCVDDLLILRRFDLRGHPAKAPVIRSVIWLPRAPGWTKVNTDGAALSSPDAGGCGGIFRNCRAFIKGCFAVPLDHVFAFEAELLAASITINFAWQNWWHRIWLESDSSYVVQLLSSRSEQLEHFFSGEGVWVLRLNVDEVVRLCEALSLKENDGPLMPLKVDLKDEGEKRLVVRLVGKVLSNKLVNMDAFIHLIPKIWKIKKEVEIEVVDGNMFSFTFKCAEDGRLVFKGGPWRFDKALLVLVEPKENGDIQAMSFNKATFWVQIHNVPLLCMTKEIEIFLGKMIGEFREIDVGPSGECVGHTLGLKAEDIVGVDTRLQHSDVDVDNGTKEPGPIILDTTRLLLGETDIGNKGHVAGPKIGKWKRWACDGTWSMTSEDSEAQPGKRISDTKSEGLCVGDFNEILDDFEKEGGLTRPRERLDRCVSNLGWRDFFLDSKVTHLEFWKSDHRLILLEVIQTGQRNDLWMRLGQRRFHFEECWASHDECAGIIEHAWGIDDGRSNMGDVVSGIRRITGRLKTWTLIILIPKVKSAERMVEFCPISLCNVMYKIIEKALANRFRLALGEVDLFGGKEGRYFEVPVQQRWAINFLLFFMDDSLLFLKASEKDC
ncbi:hypothetical protein Ddye_015762 [Dipteronia dyeriana]|uniref:DUF4283 domain-containing protein n=1 Tax=Dipteronia dyeriana TaxID=168575 RepID=A0AAD9WZF9_9ROSI|nr:hypothetical protein Ddye_015762 [Dipteronia dyeriana]